MPATMFEVAHFLQVEARTGTVKVSVDLATLVPGLLVKLSSC